MESNLLFHSLTEAMFGSIWQALIIYLLCRAILFLLPWMSSAFRYRVLYLGLSISTFLFVSQLISALSERQPASVLTTMAQAVVPEVLNLRTLVHMYASQISVLYVSGIVLQVVMLVLALLKINHLKSDKNLVHNEMWQLRMVKLGQSIGLNVPVKIYFSHNVSGPFTIGWWKPVVFFPLSALTSLSTSQIEAILIHELAHIKRYDYLWNILQRSMEIVLFFNPITWAYAAALNKEREFCCDDVVMDKDQSPLNYAKALLLLQQDAMTSRLIMQAAKKEHPLYERIKRLSNPDANRTASLPKSIILAGLLVALSFIGWVAPAETNKPTEPKETSVTDSVINMVSVVNDTAATKPAVKVSKSITITSNRHSAQDRKSHGGSAISIILPTEAACPPVPPAPAANGSVSIPVAPQPPAPPVAPKHIVFLNKPGMRNEMRITTTVNDDSSSKSLQQAILASRRAQESVEHYFKSKEWQNKLKDIEKESEKIARLSEKISIKMQGKEWQANLRKIKESSENITRFYNSPEWKKHIEEITRQAETMGRSISIHFTDSLQK